MEHDKFRDVTVFVDESGTISKGQTKKEDYFIITLMFVDNDRMEYVKKLFKRYRFQVIKKKKVLLDELKENGEIKGSELSEHAKSKIYSKLLEKCEGDFELAIIVLDNTKATSRFKSNTSRVFNYLIKTYLNSYFIKYSRYKNLNSIKFVIDERNVATNSRCTLQEYLNTELNLVNTFAKEDINVHYYDSKKYMLLQMVDFISNTFYRRIQKHQNVEENVEKLLSTTCKGEIFRFPL